MTQTLGHFKDTRTDLIMFIEKPFANRSSREEMQSTPTQDNDHQPETACRKNIEEAFVHIPVSGTLRNKRRNDLQPHISGLRCGLKESMWSWLRGGQKFNGPAYAYKDPPLLFPDTLCPSASPIVLFLVSLAASDANVASSMDE